MLKRARFGAVVTASVLLLAACGGDDDPTIQPDDGGEDAGDAIQVAMVDNSFAPSMLELPAGEEVTITTPNNGENPHSFTIDDLVDTGVIDGGESTEVTFTVPEGETQYYCTVHGAETMSGTLTGA
jgi:plastocyanin